MVVEVRKVQKLGTSSLIVTLPKTWVKKFDLKPGDKVYLVDEGDSLRIFVEKKKPKSIPIIDLTRVPDPLLSLTALHCIYVSSVDEAIIKLKDSSSIILDLKRKASEFIGLEVYEEDKESIKVKVLINSEKIDISSIIRLMGYNVAKALNILKLLLDDVKKDLEDEIKIVKKDFVRYQHAIIRYLMTKMPLEVNNVENYQAALITSYLGYINDVILDLVEKYKQKAKSFSRNIIPILDDIERIMYEVVANITSPSLKRLGLLCGSIEGLRGILNETLDNINEKDLIIILSRLYDVLRVINIITCVLMCKAIVRA